MKCISLLDTGVLLFTLVQTTQAQSGDQAFWLPLKPDVDPQTAQIVRNKEYVSIKLQAVFAYYKSSFLENIKQLLVASDIAVTDGTTLVEGTILNKALPKLDSTGDF